MIETISIVLILIGIVGVFFPALPGLVLSYAGLLLFTYIAHKDIAISWIITFGVLTAMSVVLGFVIPVSMSKKYGGTTYGNMGGYVGMIIGFFTPIPFGIIVGMFAGIFIGEYMTSTKKDALQATKGAVIGFLYSTSFNFLVGLGMLILVIYKLL